MKTTIQQTFRLTALSAALMTIFGSALADDAEVNKLIKPDSSISVGIGNWTEDRQQQGIYDGMREKGPYGLLDADIVKRDDATGTWLKLNASNLGLDNREIKLEFLRQGDIGASFEYNRISRDNPNTYNTRLLGIGTTTQTVSTALVPGPLQTVKLGTDRDLVSIGFFKNMMSGFDFNLSFKNEDKTGTRAWGRGSAAEFAVEPINSTTRQLEGTLSYTREALQLSGGYYGSWYDNKNNMVTVQTAGLTAPTYLSLPLDNQAHQLFMNGGYTFTPTTRGTIKLSYTRAMQNEYLPTQDIAGLSLAGSPSSLSGLINTKVVQVGVTSRPINNLSLLANFRYNDAQDETPVNRFVQTNAACGSGQCVDNTPFSYTTRTAKLEGTYRLPEGYSLTAGVEGRGQDRTVPVSNANGTGGSDTQRVVPLRSKVDEVTSRLELRRGLSETVNGTLAYLISNRTGSSYIPAVSGPGGGTTAGITGVLSDLIHPINTADRKRNKLRMALDWAPTESMSLQFNVEGARDEYSTDKPYGMRDGTAQLYSVDASYTFNDAWRLNGWATYDRNNAHQVNSRATNAGTVATAEKDYNLEEAGSSLGLGLRGDVTGKVKVGADLQWTRNISKYQEDRTLLSAGADLPAAFTAPLPDNESILVKLTLFSEYALDKQSNLRVNVIHERWKTNDWSWMFADGTPFAYRGALAGGDGTTVTANQEQISNSLNIRYIYMFQ